MFRSSSTSAIVGISDPNLFQVQRSYSVAEIPLRRKKQNGKPRILEILGEMTFCIAMA
jgi:hypothetical protein